MIEGEKELCGGYLITAYITYNNSHPLKYRNIIGGDKGLWWLLIRTYKKSMQTHLLKQKHDRRREKRCCGYSQPNTQNNSMKTHHLKHRHDKRREKKINCYSQQLNDNSHAEVAT